MNQPHSAVREKVLTRLNRIEGQVRGIKKMVENDRRCLDVLRQIAATDAALRSAAKLIITQHLDNCIEESLHDKEARKRLFEELLECFGRFG